MSSSSLAGPFAGTVPAGGPGISRRRLLGTATGLALASTAAGCGTAADDASLELSDGPVTLRATWWGGEGRHELTYEVIEQFQARHPRITVEGEFADWSGYWDRLATTTAAGASPDVIQMDQLYLRSYGDRGAIRDLRTLSQLDTSGFEDSVLAQGSGGDALYGISIGTGVVSICANLDLLDEYGVEVPDDSSWTFADLAEISRGIAEASGGDVYGCAPFGGDSPSLTVWALQQGDRLFDEDGRVVIQPAVVESYWAFGASLVASGAAPPASLITETSTLGIDQSLLATGRVAFAMIPHTQLLAYTEAGDGARFRLLRFPRQDGAEGGGNFYKPSMYWSVSARSEHPAEAALLVDFLVNDPAAAEVLGVERGVPANTEIRELVSAGLEGPDLEASDFIDVMADDVSSVPAITPTGASDIDTVMARYNSEVLFGADPAEAARQFVAEITVAVDSARA